MSPALIGFLLGALLGSGLWVPVGWCLRVKLAAAQGETRPIPAHRPHLQLVTGEELERRAAEARN